MKDKQPKRITLDLKDARLSSRKFLRAVNAFFDLLTSVSDEVGGTKGAVKWYVTVKPGSVKIIAEAEVQKVSVTVPGRAITTIHRGVAMMEKKDQRPPYFSDYALKKVRELASLSNGSGPARIIVGRKANPVTLHSAENVRQILGPSLEVDGSVEGRLNVISGRQGPKIFVDDLITGRSVECGVSKDQMKEALQHFGERVIADGVVRYRRDGEATSIIVKHLNFFDREEDLPPFREMRGIL